MRRIFQQALLERCRVEPGQAVLVALSGGPDSVALLHLLLSLRDDWPLTLCAAHLDHALRPESGRDADWAAELCRAWQVPLVCERIEVAARAAQEKRGIEETARDIRYVFLHRVAREQGCELIALGHHGGDQAETVLHRLVRGAGGSGLAGMAWRRDRLIRPLLGATRVQLLGYLRENRLPWLEDPSNRDPDFTRNRIRHELIPLLEEFNPRVTPGLMQLAERLALEEDYWGREVDRTLVGTIETGASGDGELRVPVAVLRELHPALRVRTLRELLRRVRGDLQGIAAVHIGALDLLLQGRSQAELDLPGAWAARRYKSLWLRPVAPEWVAGEELQIGGPGRFDLADGSHLSVEALASRGMESLLQAEFAADQLQFPLVLRHPRPGDRFRPAGLDGTQKLKKYFIDRKLTREARQAVWVLEEAASGEILWLPGLRRCHGRQPAAEGQPALRLSFQPPKNQTNALW